MNDKAAGQPYRIAFAAVTVSSLLSLILAPWIARAPTPFFTSAIVFAAYYGGFRAALFAAVLAAVARYFIFFYRDGTGFGLDDLVVLALFLGVAAFIGHLLGAIREREEALRVTLASIGDAVITTDSQGRVRFLNPKAEQLTGWNTFEAQGQPLETVFRIINEETRQPAEAPVQRVLKEGRVCGLANHTTLICRDGKEKFLSRTAPRRFEMMQDKLAGL